MLLLAGPVLLENSFVCIVAKAYAIKVEALNRRFQAIRARRLGTKMGATA